jgi:hypothetical protein
MNAHYHGGVTAAAGPQIRRHDDPYGTGIAEAYAVAPMPDGEAIIGRARVRAFNFPPVSGGDVARHLAIADLAAEDETRLRRGRPTPSNVIVIRWGASDLAPASQAGRICITDMRYGETCASYVIGEKPADTLTRQLEAALHVESAGSG